MPDILATLAKAHPHKSALIDDRPDRLLLTLSFAELNERVNRLANALLELGVSRGDKVVWCGMNSAGVVTMMNAARKIGAVAVPLNYRLTPEEAAFVVDNCDATAVYIDADFAELALAIRPDCPEVRDWLVYDGKPPIGMEPVDKLMNASIETEPPEPSEGEPPAATITYTSGTTGKPKGAVRRGLGDPEAVRRLIDHIGYVPDDVYLTTGPLYHSGPGGFMSIGQMLGNTVILQRRFDAEDWLRLVDKYRVTSTFSAPTPIRLVTQLSADVKERYDTSSMKRMIANAAPWSWVLKEAYLACFPEDSLWEVYGSTELGVNTILEPRDQRRKRGSCGKPAPSVEIKLLDDDGEKVTGPNAAGELFVRSKTVFDSYYEARDKYEEDRRGDFHTVGDMAYFDEEGFYFICDRKKDMIISGGMNIYPAEIEAVLEQHPLVLDVAVFGIPSEDWGESVHAVIVVKPGETPDEAAVACFAREYLAGYKVPRSVSFVDEIPRTGSGKILKRVLRKPFWRDHQSQIL